MKNIFIALLFVAITAFSFAQNKPEKNTFGLGVDVSLKSLGSIPTFRLDYYLDDKNSFKLFYRPSFTSSNSENFDENIDKTTSNYYKRTENTYSMSLGLGYERHFLPNSKFDPFVGVNVAYSYSGKSKSKSENINTGSADDVLYRVGSNREGVGVEGHGVNLGINLGANYFILRNLSIGADFGLGYGYSVQKGISKSTLTEVYYEDNVLLNELISDFDNAIDNKNHGLIYNVSIKAAYYFNFAKKKE